MVSRGACLQYLKPKPEPRDLLAATVKCARALFPYIPS